MKLYETHEAARILGLPETRIQSCARLGYLGPGRREGELRLSFQDLLVLEATRGLMDSGVSARRIARVLGALRRQLASARDPARLTVYAEGDRVVVADGDARWETDSGQMLMELDAPVGPARSPTASGGRPAAADTVVRPPAVIIDVTELAARAAERSRGARHASRVQEAVTEPAPADDSGSTAEQWFEHACELEEDAPAESIQSYLRALELDPGLTDAHVNLGLLYHEAGEPTKAESHYREAARHAPDDPIPWFNLGVLLEDQERKPEAIQAYEQALIRDRDCADAHYNVGLLLERQGRKPEALAHLMKARRLYARRGS